MLTSRAAMPGQHTDTVASTRVQRLATVCANNLRYARSSLRLPRITARSNANANAALAGEARGAQRDGMELSEGVRQGCGAELRLAGNGSHELPTPFSVLIR